ncbi:hypothetical protein CICLE_v10003030mg [Citrus x clementina]|uniref:Uncharacterized protein n=1 Tax=Citrus clementina TaxID=85681 RepID=V4T2G3_CITCL|nr:hypothetical protein CICLE_v10003030mg [Citrus x clementina]
MRTPSDTPRKPFSSTPPFFFFIKTPKSTNTDMIQYNHFNRNYLHLPLQTLLPTILPAEPLHHHQDCSLPLLLVPPSL